VTRGPARLPRPARRLRTQLLAAFAVVAVVALAAGGTAVVRQMLDYRAQATNQRLLDAVLSAGAAGAALERQGVTPAAAAAGIASQVPLTGARVLVVDLNSTVLADWRGTEATPDAESLAGQQLDVPGGETLPQPGAGGGAGGGLPDRATRGRLWRGSDARGSSGYLFVAADVPGPPAVDPQRGGAPGLPTMDPERRGEVGPPRPQNRVVLAVPLGNLRSGWEELAAGLAGAAAVALLAAAAAAWALAGSIDRPILAITGAAERLARGERHRPVPEAGAAEVAQLARGFNAMAEEVERSQATLRAFVADASHELRTPLTAIQGFSQAVEDGVLEAPDSTRRAALHIQRETQRMRRLVEDLLLLSKMEARERALVPRPVDVSELLDTVAQRLQPAVGHRGLRLSLHLPERLLVAADATQLEHLFGNLLQNAAKYTPEGGIITVRAAPAPAESRRQAGAGAARTVTVTVHNTADAATAIPAEAVPHLFERFYRVDKSRSRGTGEAAGSGLGLAIAREIAERHGGAVGVASDPVAGTTFTVSLPGWGGAAVGRPGENAAITGSGRRPRGARGRWEVDMVTPDLS
jgi:signal transduction histidine kinase